MIALHQVYLFNVGRQLRFEYEGFVANIAFVRCGNRIMLFEHMPVPLIVTSERLVAARTVRRVPSGSAVVRILLVAHFPHSRTKHFVAKLTLEIAYRMCTLMVLQTVFVYEPHVAHIAYVIPVVSVHMLQEHFERGKRQLAQRARHQLTVRQLELRYIIVDVRIEPYVVFCRQVFL